MRDRDLSARVQKTQTVDEQVAREAQPFAEVLKASDAKERLTSCVAATRSESA